MSMVDAPGAGLLPAAARALLTGLTGDLGACSKQACMNIVCITFAEAASVPNSVAQYAGTHEQSNDCLGVSTNMTDTVA